MRATLLSLALGLALVPAAGAVAQQQATDRPVVVELFTSQGCSSCPPADAVLRDLARTRRDVLPLSFHVTYWDYLGWRDPYSLQAATDRQRAYADLLGDHSVYTPEMVVDGAQSFVGSRGGEADAAIQRATSERRTAAQVRVARQGGTLTVEIGQSMAGVADQGTVLLVGFDPEHSTPVGRGENDGRLLLEANVVRSLQAIGRWSGAPLRLQLPLPAGERFAALLEAPDGHIIGAGL